MLEAGDVVEVLRRLDQRDALVAEVAERGAQEVWRGDVIGIQECQDLGVDDAKRIVDVPRLGVLVRRPREVAGTERGSQLGDLRPLAVVEDPCLVHRLERDRRGDGRHQDLRPLVEGRNEHGDAGDPHAGRGGAAARRRPTG